MPQSLNIVVIHVVFSTKERRPLIAAENRSKLHAYLATVTRNAGCEAYRVGGVADHVHLAIRLSRTITIADLVETLKTSSSKWMKTQSPNLADFAWQRGYGCFSVGPSDLDTLKAYIIDQENHHRTKTFQEEFRMFLKNTAWNSTRLMFGIEHWGGLSDTNTGPLARDAPRILTPEQPLREQRRIVDSLFGNGSTGGRRTHQNSCGLAVVVAFSLASQ